jgi:hypothetical protein
MSLFLDVPPPSVLADIDIVLDVPARSHSHSLSGISSSPQEIVALVQQLRSKTGVAIIRCLSNGTTAEKIIHVDSTGLFLVYTPTSKIAIRASIHLTHISEVRIDGPVGRCFRRHPLAPVELCLSLMLCNGAPAMCFLILEGTQQLWKASLEFLVARAHRVIRAKPLMSRVLHLWFNCTLSNLVKQSALRQRSDPVEKILMRNAGNVDDDEDGERGRQLSDVVIAVGNKEDRNNGHHQQRPMMGDVPDHSPFGRRVQSVRNPSFGSDQGDPPQENSDGSDSESDEEGRTPHRTNTQSNLKKKKGSEESGAGAAVGGGVGTTSGEIEAQALDYYLEKLRRRKPQSRVTSILHWIGSMIWGNNPSAGVGSAGIAPSAMEEAKQAASYTTLHETWNFFFRVGLLPVPHPTTLQIEAAVKRAKEAAQPPSAAQQFSDNEPEQTQRNMKPILTALEKLEDILILHFVTPHEERSFSDMIPVLTAIVYEQPHLSLPSLLLLRWISGGHDVGGGVGRGGYPHPPHGNNSLTGSPSPKKQDASLQDPDGTPAALEAAARHMHAPPLRRVLNRISLSRLDSRSMNSAARQLARMRSSWAQQSSNSGVAAEAAPPAREEFSPAHHHDAAQRQAALEKAETPALISRAQLVDFFASFGMNDMIPRVQTLMDSVALLSEETLLRATHGRGDGGEGGGEHAGLGGSMRTPSLGTTSQQLKRGRHVSRGGGNRETALDLGSSVHTMDSIHQVNHITSAQFVALLSDPLLNGWMNPLHQTVYQPMNHPPPSLLYQFVA